MPDPYPNPENWTPPYDEETPPIYRPNDTTTFRGEPLSDVPLLDVAPYRPECSDRCWGEPCIHTQGDGDVNWTQPAPRSCGVCGAKDNHNGVPHSEVEEERRRSRGGDI